MNLVIITPFKNEEVTIKATLESICRQTVKPLAWLLIDDNSTDASPAIVKEFEKKFDFIKYYNRNIKKDDRATGGNVVSVFYYGLQKAADEKIDWDIVLKLDADLDIDRDDYLAFFINKFTQSPLLGIASGTTYVQLPNGEKKFESKHRWHTQGPNKFYRKECFKAIGGLKPFKGWDGIDDILARDKGYLTQKYSEQTLRHFYSTQTRNAEGGVKMGLLREAEGYQNRAYPFYMFFFKALKLARQKGIGNGAFFLWTGLKLKLFTKPKVTKEEQKAIRKFFVSRLFNRIKFAD